MYCEGTVGILDGNDCRAATHVFIYTHTPSAADSLRPRDGTQWLDDNMTTNNLAASLSKILCSVCKLDTCTHISSIITIFLKAHKSAMYSLLCTDVPTFWFNTHCTFGLLIRHI